MGRTRLAVVVVFLAGCTAGTTPASTTTTSATTTTAAPADVEGAAAAFQTCMSAAGVVLAEVPLDPSGRPDLSALASDTATTFEFREALSYCAPLLGSFLALDQRPGLAALVRDQLVRYAQCMRASGVEDFPDPLVEFEGTSAPFPSERIPLDDPEFRDAVEACASAIAVS
ncbi:MAG: hypothetical protein ACR2NT_06480 [Acidimicrobiia bacterium]